MTTKKCHYKIEEEFAPFLSWSRVYTPLQKNDRDERFWKRMFMMGLTAVFGEGSELLQSDTEGHNPHDQW